MDHESIKKKLIVIEGVDGAAAEVSVSVDDLIVVRESTGNARRVAIMLPKSTTVAANSTLRLTLQ